MVFTVLSTDLRLPGGITICSGNQDLKTLAVPADKETYSG